MRVKLFALAMGASVLVAGCGSMANGPQGVATIFGVTLDKNGQPYVMSATERQLARFGLLETTDACATCDVTGGGNGNTTDFACGGANFGFSAITTPTDRVNGHLNFLFAEERGRYDVKVGGQTDFVRCVELFEGANGDTYGTVVFGGPLSQEDGISGSPETFLVTVQDYGEPNVDDDFKIEVLDGAEPPNVLYTYTCRSEDGNIQIHPTRFANL